MEIKKFKNLIVRQHDDTLAEVKDCLALVDVEGDMVQVVRLGRFVNKEECADTILSLVVAEMAVNPYMMHLMQKFIDKFLSEDDPQKVLEEIDGYLDTEEKEDTLLN